MSKEEGEGFFGCFSRKKSRNTKSYNDRKYDGVGERVA